MTQVMLKTSAITLFFAFVIFSYGLTVFGFAFPKVMADLSVSLGAHNAAGMYFERVWERDETPENLYFTLDRYILAQNHRKIIQFGDRFFALSQPTQDDIIVEANKQWEERARASLPATDRRYNLVAWANESSRIKTAYIVALMRTGKTSDAFLKLDAWLLETPDVRHPNHAFIVAFRIDDTAKGRLETYVTELTKDSGRVTSIYALDFLWEAHALLGDPETAQTYARLFYEHTL